MANTNYITSSVQNGYGKSFIATGKFPIVAKRAWQTYADALEYAGDLADSCFAGVILAVINDDDAKKNGVYLVESCPTLQNPDAEVILTKVGDGAGAEAVTDYASALLLATEDNMGQILYVKTTTYKKGEGYTAVEDEADVDAEGNIVAEYTAGPYIVTGAGTVAKLGTTSATGDIAGDVENLKGRMGTAEGEIDALQVAVGDANSGLVKGLADANGAIDAVEGRMDTAEGEIDALQGVVGNAEAGLVKDVAALQALTGEHAGTLTKYGSRISANETAVSELRGAVAGGTHFKGVYPELPKLSTDDEAGTVVGTWHDSSDEENTTEFIEGDIIIVDGDDISEDISEPTSEYILVIESSVAKWVFLGNCAASDQKIAKVEKDFNDHVAAMETAWSEHLAEADEKYALATGLQAAEKALEDHVAAMVPTVEAAADYVANKSTFALAANVVANETFNQHVIDASGRMDGIDQTIANLKVKDVDTSGVLSLTDGVVGIDLGNYVTKDGSKVLSDENYTAAEKAKLEAIAAGAQVNVIETVKVNGSAIAVDEKAINIDMVDHLAAKLSINGQVLAEVDNNGVLSAVVDASDIHLGAAIGDYAAEDTTVQGMLSAVYDIANSKIGSIHLAEGATANVLALSKTNIANDTIELKIAEGSSIKATATGLDLVWTEL